MRHSRLARIASLALTALIGASGCQTTGSYLLSAFGLKKDPLAVALVLDGKPGDVAGALNPFPRYTAMQKTLGEALKRPVAVDPCFVFQASSGLNTGWYGAAIVTPTQYAHLPEDARPEVLVVSLDENKRPARPALLIVSAKSEITNIEQLNGLTVAFGPKEDARTHHAALQLLRKANIAPENLSLEVLPVPGLKHMPNDRSVFQTVANDSSDAGFVDVAAWEALPEHGTGDELARDQFRVIAKTIDLPGRLVLASPKLDADTANALVNFLTTVDMQHPEVIAPIGIGGYQRPPEGLVAACADLTAGEMTVPSGPDANADE